MVWLDDWKTSDSYHGIWIHDANAVDDLVVTVPFRSSGPGFIAPSTPIRGAVNRRRRTRSWRRWVLRLRYADTLGRYYFHIMVTTISHLHTRWRHALKHGSVISMFSCCYAGTSFDVLFHFECNTLSGGSLQRFFFCLPIFSAIYTGIRIYWLRGVEDSESLQEINYSIILAICGRRKRQ